MEELQGGNMGYKYKTHFKPCLLLFAVVLVLFGITLNEIHASSLEIEALKSFLVSERDRGEVVFTYEFLPILPMTGKPMSISAHRVKWQPDSFYAMQVRETNSVNSPSTNDIVVMGGKAGETPWDYSHSTLNIYDRALNTASASLLKNQQHSFLSRLYAVIGFGIMHVPGTLKWDGNTFTAEPYGSTVQLEGEIVCDASGIPASIKKSFNGNISQIKLIYEGQARNDGLPAGFDLASLNQKGEMEVHTRIRILSLSTTNAIVDESEFTASAVLASLGKQASGVEVPIGKPLLTIVHSNSANYFIRSNRMVLMKEAKPKPGSGNVFIVLMLLSAPALFLMLFFLKRKTLETTKGYEKNKLTVPCLATAILAAILPLQELSAYMCNAVNVPYFCVLAQQQPIVLGPYRCMKSSNGIGEQCETDDVYLFEKTGCINKSYSSGCAYEIWASCAIDNSPDTPPPQPMNSAYETTIADGDCPN